MKLRDLLARLPGAGLRGDPGLEIADVTHDSRRCGPGSLFVAIRGLATDGNRFVDAARKKGAVAVCSEEPPSGEGTWVRVPDARVALATLSAAILGEPARSLELVGVTGTNGKTTTAYLIASIFDRLEVEIARVVISDLIENTFYASLYLLHNNKEFHIDSRPSDAIAVAIRIGAPVFVEEEVIAKQDQSTLDTWMKNLGESGGGTEYNA